MTDDLRAYVERDPVVGWQWWVSQPHAVLARGESRSLWVARWRAHRALDAHRADPQREEIR